VSDHDCIDRLSQTESFSPKRSELSFLDDEKETFLKGILILSALFLCSPARNSARVCQQIRQQMFFIADFLIAEKERLSFKVAGAR